ncbi:hypothetical protein V5F77_05415 [Xanthobacter sp. DSM 24535]|uniref:hypothetical protein n=1 Tax=Roseixanthobacter psychrophilus TaxID=3119917 RepID=UPI00372C62E9
MSNDTNTNSPANTLPIGAGDREAGSPPGPASRTLRERVATAIRQQVRADAAPPPINHYLFGIEEAADAAIAEVMAWQPIETAPNFEAILVCYDDDSVTLIEGDDNFYEWGEYKGHTEGVVSPTRWMPLPSPPKGEK